MDTWKEFGQFLAQYGLNILAAVAILVVGWVVAWAISALVRRGLKRTVVHRRIVTQVAGDDAAASQLETWAARLVFAVLMLFVVIAVFEALLLQSITAPLSEMLAVVLDYVPRLLGALFLVAVAWAVASLLRAVIRRGLDALNLDQRLGEPAAADATKPSLAQAISGTVYWLVFLLFLPAVLGALELRGLLGPVETMLQKVLGYLPNIAVAALIFGVGWLVARFVQRIVVQALDSTGIDTTAERYGVGRALGKGYTASQTVGVIVYILILLPVVVAGLNALQLEALTNPVENVLTIVLEAIPALFAAAVVLTLAYVVGRFVSGLIAELLGSTSFDQQMARLGVKTEQVDETGGRTASQLVGSLTLIAIMLFATMEALNLLQFQHVADLIAEVLVFFGQVLVGLVVIGLGLYLANLAANTIRSSSNRQAARLALVARVAIIALAVAMGLQQMGFGEDIINLAFGLILGSIAIAAAIAFGVGGRDLAARELEHWTGGGSAKQQDGSNKKSS